MRTVFRASLAALDSDLVKLTEQVAEVLRTASDAALGNDLVLAEAALSEVVDIEQAAQVIADCTVNLLARQQPVAHDLRALLGAHRMASSLLRMARLAGSIAKAARRRYPRGVVPKEVNGVVVDMAGLAHDMVVRAGRALSSHDVGALGVLLGLDRQMDRLHLEMLTIIRSAAWPYDVDSAVDLTMLSRDYERFADHAVEIGAAVVYVATGLPPPSRPA